MTERGAIATGSEDTKMADPAEIIMQMRPAVRKWLDEQAALENRPAWRIVDEALTAYLERHHPAHLVGIGHLD